MPISKRPLLRGLVAACSAAVVSGAAAQGLPPPPQNVVSLSASASVEVTKDWLTVVFSTTREGPDAAVVQSQLRQALDQALTEARKGARPGQLEVQTGGFSLHPRYAPLNPKAPGGQPAIAGWLGSTELVVEGRYAQAIAQLIGRIQSLSIARVGFSLSREAREKVEGEVSAQAIAHFRARADAVSRQFGFSGYSVREVNVSSNEPPGGIQPMMRAQASRAMADESLPVEAGKAVVTATVSGSVQMVK